MKSHKTPLRYPGGKSRACTKMDQYLLKVSDSKEYREPFLGGGSVAIHITKSILILMCGSMICMNLFIIFGEFFKMMVMLYMKHYVI